MMVSASGKVCRLVCAALVLATGPMVSGAVHAAGPDGWSLTGTSSVTVDATLNPTVQPGSGGNEFEPQFLTNFELLLERKSQTSTLALRAALAPGFARGTANDLLNRLAPSVGGSLTVQGRRMAFDASFDSSFRNTAFTDANFPDPADQTVFTLVNGTAVEASLAGSVGFTIQLNQLNSLSISASAARTDYFDGAISLVPSTSADLTLSWDTNLTQRLTSTWSASLGWFKAQGQTSPRSISLDLANSVAFIVNRRLSVNGSLGVTFVDTEELRTPGGVKDRDFSTTISGALGFSYALNDLTVSGAFSQNVRPSSFGTLQNTSAVNLNLNYLVNNRMSFGLDTRFQFQSAVGGGNQTTVTSFQIAPGLSYQFDQYTSGTVGYRFDLSRNAGRESTAHSVFLTLTRNFNFLP